MLVDLPGLAGLPFGTDQSGSKPLEVEDPATDLQELKGAGGEQAMSPQDPFVRRYTGLIGAEYPIDMLLINWGDGFLSGRFAYQQTGIAIEIQGEMSLDETVELQGYVKDQAIDKFTFSYTDLDQIKGQWEGLKNKKQLDFELTAVPPSPQTKAWGGNWYLNGTWDGGQLLIGDVRDTAFYFALTVLRNGHNGVVDGEAQITGDSAVFESMMEMGFDDEACNLHFFLRDTSIYLQQRSSTSSCGFGMRAYAEGIYDNKSLILKPELPFGTEKAVFVDASQHEAFKSWIGEEEYLKIAWNMQTHEAKAYHNPQEGIQGQLSEGMVLGLLTTNEAIVLHDGDRAFWAATIDSEGEEAAEFVIRYYTNQKAWARKLPKAFEYWRQSFPSYQVLYLYKE